jgi:tetratricopeptide (TPR) repeat protein
MTVLKLGTLTLMATLLALLFASMLFMTVSRAADVTPPRFEDVVRADFFAGFRGDAARLQRGMELCETTLAADPEHAEALVWHGAGLVFLAGRAAAAQDPLTAQARMQQGWAEMDRAIAIAPDALGVMLVRAVTLSAAASRLRDRELARTALRSAVSGFERALTLQTPYFEQLPVHSRGELLAGLAEGYSRLGDAGKARRYLERMVSELPDSPYQARARAWLEDGAESGQLTCLTCHRR